MKVAVIGAGAIGSLVAAYLADKGEDVALAAHPAQCAEISKSGLNIEGTRGRMSVKVAAKERLDDEAQLVVLATKTQDLEKALSENINYLKDSLILTVQNGIRAEEIIARRLGKDNLFSSIVMFGATNLAPGKVVHNFEGDWILGKADSTESETLKQISNITSQIFPSPIAGDIMAMKWLKLFLNANNCLPAILGKSMQETFKNLSICKISMQIWREGWGLVNRARINLSSLPNFPLERISNLLDLPEDKSAGIFSNIMTNLSKEPLYGSILQSIKRNRPSEIDYINGEFLRLAESVGQRASLNEKLVQMVHQVEKDKQFFSEEELLKETLSLRTTN
ncbi:MAG: ketopantoate reductase family protein [Candidatus Omnitrophota bacterium]|nr:MAG: ketopantoate reductase family protein [Candidatus Omnitrophota bacterium]